MRAASYGLSLFAAILLTGTFSATFPAAAAYPDRPITMLVAWGAGGGTDTVTRMFSALLEKELGQRVNVVNRTGGSGVVGHVAMATAPADGYTIGVATMEITVFKSLGLADIDPRSFTPIARIAAIPAGVTVAADAPYQNAGELLQAIKDAPPGTFKSSGTGVGGAWHLAVAGWMQSAGLEPMRVQWVPSQGGAPALQDLVAGGLQLVTASVVESRSLLEAGKVRALAVMNDERQDAFPQVPTLQEATGSDWTMSTWFGVVGPAGLPDDVRKTLLDASRKVHQSKEFRDFMAQRGYVPVWEEPAEFAAFMEQSSARLEDLIDELGLAK